MSRADADAAMRMLPAAWTTEELSAGGQGVRFMAHWPLIAIIGLVAVAAAWAAYFEIDEVSHADGKVITASQTQYVQSLEGGIITEILVREGDRVQKGQVLFKIDPTRFSADFREGKQVDLGLRAKAVRLLAEATGAREVTMPADVSSGAPSLAQSELALYRARLADLANRSGLLHEQLTQREQELVEIRARAKHHTEARNLLEREIAITALLVKQGVVSEVDCFACSASLLAC